MLLEQPPQRHPPIVVILKDFGATIQDQLRPCFVSVVGHCEQWWSLRHRRRDPRAAPLALRVRCWPLGVAAFSRCCRPQRIRRHAPQAATPAARVRFWALRAAASACINWLPTRRRHAPRAAAPALPVRSGPLCAVVLPSIRWLRRRQRHTPQEKSFSSVADCYVQRRQPVCMGRWPSRRLHAAGASAPGGGGGRRVPVEAGLVPLLGRFVQRLTPKPVGRRDIDDQDEQGLSNVQAPTVPIAQI